MLDLILVIVPAFLIGKPSSKYMLGTNNCPPSLQVTILGIPFKHMDKYCWELRIGGTLLKGTSSFWETRSWNGGSVSLERSSNFMDRKAEMSETPDIEFRK